MHEGAIAQGILTTALGALPSAGIHKITRISIVVGTLAGVVPESLELFFRELSSGTRASDAALEIKFKQAELVCRKCNARVEHDSGCPVALNCVVCGGFNHLEGGREMFLEEMEIAEDL